MSYHNEKVHNILGIIGNVASVAFFLSSTHKVANSLKRKSSAELPGKLFVFQLFNCILWAFYGLPIIRPHNFWVVVTNSTGSMVASVYIISYLIFATKPKRLKVIWGLLVVFPTFVITVVLVMEVNYFHQLRTVIVGVMCCIVSGCMHFMLLFQMGGAVKAGLPTSIQPVASVSAFIKAAVWTAYGVVLIDVYIIIPNVIGMAVGITQIFLCVYIVYGGVNTDLPATNKQSNNGEEFSSGGEEKDGSNKA